MVARFRFLPIGSAWLYSDRNRTIDLSIDHGKDVKTKTIYFPVSNTLWIMIVKFCHQIFCATGSY